MAFSFKYSNSQTHKLMNMSIHNPRVCAVTFLSDLEKERIFHSGSFEAPPIGRESIGGVKFRQ